MFYLFREDQESGNGYSWMDPDPFKDKLFSKIFLAQEPDLDLQLTDQHHISGSIDICLALPL